MNAQPGLSWNHDKIKEISSHYEFFAMRQSEVLKRRHAFWCAACCDMISRGRAGMDAAMVVRRRTAVPPRRASSSPLAAGTPRSRRTCAPGTRCYPGKSLHLDSRDQAIVNKGKAVAMGLTQRGMWVLVEAFDKNQVLTTYGWPER